MTGSRIFVVILLGLSFLPAPVSAATFATQRTLVVSESPTENIYLAGTDVTVAAPLPADITAAGGTLTISAPVTGDALLAGGTVTIDKPVEGDVRAVGAHITINAPVTGDIALAGSVVTASTTARDVRVIAGVARITGAGGNAVIYGSEVYLSGTFAGDVEVIASDRVTLLEGTHILGSLRYDAPQEAGIPSSAVVDDGVTYVGASSYLPTVEQAKTFAIAGASVFFVVRILAILIGAALLAGLFPAFSQLVADKALSHSPGRFILLALLGFGIAVATPVLMFILLVSFVGAGVAFLLAAAYALLLMLGYLYAGILAGAALGRSLLNRPRVTWKVALLGMFVLYFISVIPVFGSTVLFVLMMAATGSIAAIAYRFAFGRTEDAPDALPVAPSL